jgi:hypothetical protein
MRLAAVAISLAFLAHVGGEAHGLEFPGTCRGPKATVTAISGIDTRTARMTARHTRADAIDYCTYELSLGRERTPPVGQVSACAARFMRERKNVVQEAQADCRAGTLTTIARGLPTSVFPQATWRASYKFPISPTCGGDNAQAVAVFRILCPSYRGKIEDAALDDKGLDRSEENQTNAVGKAGRADNNLRLGFFRRSR